MSDTSDNVEEPEDETPYHLSGATLLLAFSVMLLLTIVIVVLTVELVDAQNRAQGNPASNVAYHAAPPVSADPNRLFTSFADVSFVCISMPHRYESHYKRLEKQLEQENLKLTWFEGINGKLLNLDDLKDRMTAHYRNFFLNNTQQREKGLTQTDYRGHLGCALSHMQIMKDMTGMTVIFEDDAELVPDFRQKFQSALASVTKLDPNWELLLLGFCCDYNHHHLCKLNDKEPIHEGGIIRVRYWFGGWAYCIRDKAAADHILKLHTPMDWHLDLAIAGFARDGKIRAYACMPTLANHAGWLRISSFDFYQIGDPAFVKTDTNS